MGMPGAMCDNFGGRRIRSDRTPARPKHLSHTATLQPPKTDHRTCSGERAHSDLDFVLELSLPVVSIPPLRDCLTTVSRDGRETSAGQIHLEGSQNQCLILGPSPPTPSPRLVGFAGAQLAPGVIPPTRHVPPSRSPLARETPL